MTTEEETLALEALARSLGISFYGDIPDAYLAGAPELPVAWAQSHGLIPVRIDGRDCLLMASPEDLEALQGASRATGRVFEQAAAPRHVIEEALARSASRRASSGAAASSRPLRIEPLKTSIAPAMQFVDSLLMRAMSEGASDVHIEPFADQMTVRFRLDGVLHRRESPPADLADAVISRIKVMAGMDISERRLPQDGMAEVTIGGRKLDVRVSTIPVAAGERIVLRLLNRSDANLPLSALGMNEAMLASFRSLVASPNGIIAITGPTGSGKTTTLYAALGELDSAKRNILTIEDPVEYRLPGIGQMQVRPKIGLTFASGLRHILRQDPDVILVGETRDAETAEIAVRASLTGHLVLTTLHTNDAPSAIVRLTDMGIEPYLVASSLRGVLAQRLVRRLCPHCKSRIALSAELQNRAFVSEDWRRQLQAQGAFAPCGCASCFGGFRGRIGLFELLLCNDAMAGLIRNGKADAAEIRRAAANGYMPLADDALAKVASGITSLDEAAGVFA